MKKLFLASMIVIYAITTNAQTQPGKFFISGSTQLNATFVNGKQEYSGQTSNYHYTQLSFQSSAGYFIVENFALGLSANWTYSKSDSYSNSLFTLGPVARLYLSSTNVKPYLVGNIGGAFERQKETSSVYNSDVKYNGLAYGAGLGIAYFINEKVSFDVQAGYQGFSLKNTDDSSYRTSTNNIVINLGFSICL